jgi:hypothetical protein
MTLFEMYELMGTIVNKDYSGNIITPARFRQLIKAVNIDYFKNKYGLPEEYQPGRPIPLEYADITLKNTDDIKAFKMFVENTPCPAGLLPYPTDYAHRDSIKYNETVTINKVATVMKRKVEILRESQADDRLSNFTKQPTVTYPIGVVRATGIQIYPVTIAQVDFSYLRWPVDPVFTYIQAAGYITYDATNSVEFEWPKDCHTDLVRMMLEIMGIRLREAEILQYANTKLQQGN